MFNITFGSHDNFLAFQNMAENLWLNYRDDNQEPEFGLADRLIDEINQAWTDRIAAGQDKGQFPLENQYPITLSASDTVKEMAESVLENCLAYDASDNPDDEPVILAGQVTIASVVS